LNARQVRNTIKKHMQEGEFHKALPLCESLVKHLGAKVTFDDWFAKGVCHFKLDQNAEAVESFNMALSLDDQNFQAIANKGISLLRLDRANEAFYVFREALSKCPRIGPVWFNIGFYHIAISNEVIGAYEKGVNAFRRAVKAHPSFTEARVYISQLEAYGTVGYLLKFAEGVPDMEDVQVLTPDQ
jgi:tetratricopeptide (TPR) repeat protein